MLKVLTVKLLSDYRAINNKIEETHAGIAAATRTFASNLGYDEAHTAALIEFVKGNDAPDGLTDDERAKLAILSAYVVDAPDETAASIAATGTAEA